MRRRRYHSLVSRRRRLSVDEKAQIVEETLAPGSVVSTIARRHRLTPQQLFTRCREANRLALAAENAEPLLFVRARQCVVADGFNSYAIWIMFSLMTNPK
ncbi:transposase [Aliidongia dinghuensis]|uniref:transposase n=1 Tax=Aliidongia dinghuensis TaxID=1867774 RepID=UPI003898F623